jgi:two-component system NtrC family sensor kinase
MEAYLASSSQEREITYREIEARNRTLESRVRDLEEAQRQIRETEDALIHAERLSAMGQLAASIVHEIRNPLAVLMGEADLVALTPGLPEGVRTRTENILEYGRHLSTLIGDVLRFSRRQEGQTQRLFLNGIILDLQGFLRLLKGKETRIQTRLTADLPQVIGDPGHIKQLLTNLILNAIDADPEGKGITISTERISPGELLERCRRSGWPFATAIGDEERWHARLEDSACATVSDSGVGIQARDLSRVFETFYTTKSRERGTGIGLSICRTIVERHHGEIVVTSKPGEGSRFHVLLPAA